MFYNIFRGKVMATFQIHEDKENYQSHAFQHVKQVYNGIQEKKIIGKKCVENRVTFQSLNNGIRHNAKRVKLSEKNNEDIREITVCRFYALVLNDVANINNFCYR